MADEVAAAAPPAATFTQFDSWNEDGEPVLSTPPKPAESAPAKEAKGKTGADASASPAQDTQEETAGSEKPKTAKRIQQLLEDKKTLQRELDALKSKPADAKPSAEPKPGDAKPAQQAQNYTDWRKDFNSKQWIDKYAADHAGSSYEEAYAAMADHLYEVRRRFETAEQARATALEKSKQSRAKATELYPDFEEVAAPMADKVLALIQNPQIDGVLKRVMLEPEGFHILYALGKDAKIAEKFEKMALSDSAEAIFIWKTLKADVRKELEKPGADGKAGAEKAEPEPPAAPKPRAPKPPSEVGGRGAVAEDALISAAKTGDFRTFDAEQTRRALASRR